MREDEDKNEKGFLARNFKAAVITSSIVTVGFGAVRLATGYDMSEWVTDSTKLFFGAMAASYCFDAAREYFGDQPKP